MQERRQVLPSQPEHLQGNPPQPDVEWLVLYAPLWIRITPSLVQAGSGPLGAYRVVSREQALGRWLTGVPEDKKATLVPPGWFDAWADATFASDPWVLPNGLLLPKRGRDCLRLPPSFS